MERSTSDVLSRRGSAESVVISDQGKTKEVASFQYSVFRWAKWFVAALI
jgi:hypothetical protein